MLALSGIAALALLFLLVPPAKPAPVIILQRPYKTSSSFRGRVGSWIPSNPSWAWAWRLEELAFGKRKPLNFSAEIYTLPGISNASFSRLQLGPPAFSTTNGLAFWLLDPPHLIQVREQLKGTEGARVLTHPRISTADGIGSRLFQGQSVVLQGTTNSVGVAIDLFTRVSSHSVDLFADPRYTELADDERMRSDTALPAMEPAIQTNLDAAFRLQVPRGKGVFLLSSEVLGPGRQRMGIFIDALQPQLSFLLVVAASGAMQAAAAGDTLVFEFRLPGRVAYRLDKEALPTGAKGAQSQWIKAWPADGSTNVVELSSRVAVQLREAADLRRLIAGHPVVLARIVAPNVFVLQAPDALAAAVEAERLASQSEVLAAYPVMRKAGETHSHYAAKPSDSLYEWQWNLENRNPDGSMAGADVNIRSAWPATQGEGITIAVADTGVELEHPELAARANGAPHWNFAHNSTNASPFNDYFCAHPKGCSHFHAQNHLGCPMRGGICTRLQLCHQHWAMARRVAISSW